MSGFIKSASEVWVIIGSLLLPGAFASALPVEPPGAEGEGAGPQPRETAETAEAVPTPEGRAERNPTTGWFYLGLGAGESAIKNFGSGLMVNAAAAVKHGRYQGTASATTASAGATGFDVGLLFGYYPHRKLGLSAGVAWARVGESREYTVRRGWLTYTVGYIEYSDTVGVPVEIRFTPVKGRVVGLGLVAHGNFNKERIFGGVTVGIELGKLK